MPAAGATLNLEALSSPSLTATRERMVTALVRISGQRNGASVLGLGPSQAEDLARNTRLLSEPTAPAIEVYTGVLFGELSHATLSVAAQQRAADRLAIASSVFGLVRTTDEIPAYRLSGSVSLPRVGTVASRWKPVVPDAIAALAGTALVVDLRSGTYVNFGKAPGSVSTRVLTAEGKIVSHFNKATKGQIVRGLLEHDVRAGSAAELVDALNDLSWHAAQTAPGSIDITLPA